MFDVIYLDPETMLPVDLETYKFDIEYANKNDQPKWDLYIDYRKDYNLTDLSPGSFYNMSNEIKTNEEMCSKYKHNSRGGGPSIDKKPCSAKEHKDYHCATIAGDSDELYNCEGWLQPYALWGVLTNTINNQWYKQK
jgi:hypothetical protein